MLFSQEEISDVHEAEGPDEITAETAQPQQRLNYVPGGVLHAIAEGASEDEDSRKELMKKARNTDSSISGAKLMTLFLSYMQ